MFQNYFELIDICVYNFDNITLNRIYYIIKYNNKHFDQVNL